MKLKFKKSIILILVFFMLFSYVNPLIMNKVYAYNQEQCGDILSKFCINFYNNYNDETIYSWNNDQRGQAYKGIKTSGKSSKGVTYTNKYAMDCVGWVSFAIHQSLGIGGEEFKVFVSPPGGENCESYDSNYFEVVCGSISGDKSINSEILSGTILKPGDILCETKAKGPHVLIYVGNGKVIHSNNGGPNGATLSYDSVEHITSNNNEIGTVLRIKQSAAEMVTHVTTVFNGYGTIKNGVDFDKYYGIATGEYVGSAPLFRFPSLGDILDWLLGFATMGIKIQLIGWSNILENLISSTMNGVSNTEDNVTSSGQETVGQQIGWQKQNKLTIESLVFNKVQLLDINVFDLNNAAGAPLDEDGVIYIIRENIAYWYYTIRQISIIGLLVCLVYIGIRMAISQIAEEKSKYKQMLVNWVVSFIIVFFIHYFMIAAIGLNNAFIGFFEEAANIDEVSLYDTIRTKSYEIKFSTGFGSTIMYMVLIFLLMKYLWIYIKRWLLVSILVILAPVMGIAYSIEKIKNNKSKTLSNWMNDFIQAVFTQTFHALIYTTFVYIAIKLALSSLPGMIIALVFLNFMADADKLVKGIFKLEGKSSGFMNRKETLKNFVAGSFVANVAINSVKRPFRLAKKAGLWTANTALGRSAFAKDVKQELGIKNELKDRKTEVFVGTLKGEWNKVKDLTGTLANTATGIGAAMMAIPMTVIEPGGGVALAFLAKSKLGKVRGNNRKIYGYKGAKNKHYVRRIAGVLTTTAIVTGPTKYAKKSYDKSKKELEKLGKEDVLLRKAIHIESQIKEKMAERNVPKEDLYEEAKRRINNRDLERNIADYFKKVDKSTVSHVISKYVKDFEIGQKLSENDIDNIIDSLSNKLKENADLVDEKNIIEIDKDKLKENIEEVIKKLNSDDLTQIDVNKISIKDMNDILNKALGKEGSIEKAEISEENKEIMEKLKELDDINKELKKNKIDEINVEEIVLGAAVVDEINAELSGNENTNEQVNLNETINSLETKKLKNGADRIIASMDMDRIDRIDSKNTAHIDEILRKAVGATGDVSHADIEEIKKHIKEKIEQKQFENKNFKKNDNNE